MRPFVGVVCTLSIASVVAAQGVTVRGLVYDSLHARPIADAFVTIGGSNTTTDSAGRFSIRLLPGNYRVTAQHDAIDRLGMSAIGAQAVVTDGRELVTVAVPSFATLWRLECGPTPPPRDTGFVFGTLRSPRATFRANVSASWIDITAIGAKISQKVRTLEVTADPRGNFALCGVPTTTGLTIRASSDSLVSGSFDVPPLDRERVVRQDLVLYDAASAAAARFAGKVVADSGGGAIVGAEVSIFELGISATTGAQGEFSLSAITPGSHRVYIRKIGYAEVEFPVDFHADERIEREVILNRITILDSMTIRGKPLARDEGMRVFEEHRKIGLGTFLTQAQLDSANGRTLAQMMVFFPSLRIELDPRSGKYLPYNTGRGPKSISPSRQAACRPAIYVDGVLERDADVNTYPPHVIAGVEWYRGPAQTPAEYSALGSGCGVIAINLRKK